MFHIWSRRLGSARRDRSLIEFAIVRLDSAIRNSQAASSIVDAKGFLQNT
jgi:hypothetical protein